MSGDPVWIDGSWEGRVDASDRGLLLGDGVFDTLVAFHRIPYAGARHLERLSAHAEAIGIPLEPDRVRDGWAAVLERAASEHLIVRTTVTRGRTGRGLWPAKPPRPTLIVSATSWNPGLLGRPVRLITSAIRRNSASPSSRLKALGYLDNILAAREVAASGADDALLLNEAGRVACTTIANVFVVRGDEIATPPLWDGVMPGIMRGTVLEEASLIGLRASERSLSPAHLREADSVFLTNSVRLVSPVTALDGAGISDRPAAAPAAFLAAIAAAVQAACGCDPRRLA